jgi:hypothetical protein
MPVVFAGAINWVEPGVKMQDFLAQVTGPSLLMHYVTALFNQPGGSIPPKYNSISNLRITGSSKDTNKAYPHFAAAFKYVRAWPYLIGDIV